MIKINTEVIKTLNPCEDRFSNWKLHYDCFNGTILDFLELEKITPRDKIWVSVRVLPKELVEIFAIDCAFSASYTDAAYAAVYAAAAYAADAYAAAAYAADAAAYAAAAYAADAAVYAAVYAADAAAYAAAAADFAAVAERENQVDALIMLIEDWE